MTVACVARYPPPRMSTRAESSDARALYRLLAEYGERQRALLEAFDRLATAASGRDVARSSLVSQDSVLARLRRAGALPATRHDFNYFSELERAIAMLPFDAPSQS